MLANRDPGRLEALKKKLYRREGVFSPQRSELPPLAVPEEREHWAPPATPVVPPPVKGSWLKRIFIASVLFFLVAVSFAAWQYFWGTNIISNRNIDLLVEGPTTASGGDEVSFSVKALNKNQKALEAAVLVVEYPPGTRSADNLQEELRAERERIGAVPPGGTITKVFRGVLFGEEKEQKDIGVTLEYRIAGSNAIFTKKTSHPIIIASSPVRLAVALPEDTISGQEVIIRTQVISNAKVPLDGLLLVTGYPPGFIFKAAEPKPTLDDNVWKFKAVDPGESKTIEIRGIMEGQNDELKTFRFDTGLAAERDEREVGITYSSLLKTITIKRPFIGLKLSVNSSDAPEVVTNNEIINQVAIGWTNDFSTEIRNGELEVILDGEAVNQQLVIVNQGHFSSSDNAVRWNKTDLPELALISPGSGGQVQFSFPTQSFLSGAGSRLSRPEITITAHFRGSRLTAEGASEPILIETSRKVKVNTVAQIVSTGLYHTGPFAPTGPVPPRIGQETLYTIQWTALNSTSDLKETKVQAVLPSYVRWQGRWTPTTENIIYNAADHTITWEVGSLLAGVTSGGARQEVAFQIGFTPSLNQIGQKPTLLEKAKLFGIDTFTAKLVTAEAVLVDTQLKKDQFYKSTEGEVNP